jgi:nucleoid DNA-binding protein
VTRADLATAAYTQAKISRAESLEPVEMMLSGIGRTLSRGEDVKLASFGAFVVRDKGERSLAVRARRTPEQPSAISRDTSIASPV